MTELSQGQLQLENLLKYQISVTSTIIKTFNEYVEKCQRTRIQQTEKLAVVEAKLSFFEICKELMEGYFLLEHHLNDILNLNTFARLKIIHSFILIPDYRRTGYITKFNQKQSLITGRRFKYCRVFGNYRTRPNSI